MKFFAYIALNTKGLEVKGKLQSDDMEAATLALRQRGLRVMEIKPSRDSQGFLGQANFSDWLASQRSVSSTSLVFFFRQMAFMLRSGIPVSQALSMAQSQISNPRLNLILRLMLKDIEAGQTLSMAMRKHEDIFSEMAINLAIAGEQTGDIDIMMERLATHLSKKAALRSQLINAMIYPAVVVLSAIGVGVFMVVKIIPKFAKFLLGKGKVLPESTQMLINISDSLHIHGLLIIGILVAVIVSILIFYQTRFGRLFIDSILLRLPIVGHFVVTASVAQMGWALSILLRSGVTIFDALNVTAGLMNNQVFSNQLEKTSEKILQGREVARSMAHPRFPVLVTQMIAVGETTGRLDEVLHELGVYYESLLEIAIKRLSALIEPVMILVVGGMVGFVYYAFFQALFSLVGG